MVDAVLAELDWVFEQMYAAGGRRSVPPEVLLKSTVLIARHSIRSERAFCERRPARFACRGVEGSSPIVSTTPEPPRSARAIASSGRASSAQGSSDRLGQRCHVVVSPISALARLVHCRDDHLRCCGRGPAKAARTCRSDEGELDDRIRPPLDDVDGAGGVAGSPDRCRAWDLAHPSPADSRRRRPGWAARPLRGDRRTLPWLRSVERWRDDDDQRFDRER